MDTIILNKLKVDFVYSSIINFAIQQNHVPIIRKLVLKNETEEDLQDLTVELSIEPDIAVVYNNKIDKISKDESIDLGAIDIILSTKYLSELTEKITGTITLSVKNEEQILYKNIYSIDFLAFDQWNGISILPEIIAAFVTPNNSFITKIISRASAILGNWTGNPSLTGYQSNNPDRVKKQMAAIYEAIAEIDITYCTPPASYENAGQKIRMCDSIFSQKLGTCIDMSLLYASCLEAIDIHPLIIVIKGHAFAGGWLINDSFADSVNYDQSLLNKRIADGINEIILVETTFMNAGKKISFDDSLKSANYSIKNDDEFLLFIDVNRARFAGIRPLPQRIQTETGWKIIEKEGEKRNVKEPEKIIIENKLTNAGNIGITKQQLWERKLLDLSLRNNLLNIRITKSTVQIISVSLNKLEDALADGEEFQILQKPTDWDNPLRNMEIYQSINQTDPIIELVKHELSQKRLRSYLTENELVKSLTNLYRSSRLSLEENGANTLYLALGLLKWYETPTSEKARYAPLLLLPVEIIKKSALKGFIIRSREEETIMNITLLEMLRQDYGIIINGLETLPHDESGVDVKKIFNNVRQGIMQQFRWDVEEQSILGTFSFNKFIMWNDIHNNSDKLSKNKIVASLITGKAEWNVEENQLITENLDEKYYPSDIVLPINADSSQFEAICSSINNKSFILHGPPGTGKSQTITNIIANALYNGKKVLFVAEKMAALSVVQKRLEAIGLAPFCLELHSNKTKKSTLFEQLKKTTEIVRKTSPEEFKLESERIYQLRTELNSYVKALHKKYPFGYSLYDSFSGYSQYLEIPDNILFKNELISSLTKEKITMWTDLVEELQVAGMLCGQIQNHPLKAIKTRQYSQQLKNSIDESISQYASTLRTLQLKYSDVCKILGIDFIIEHKQQCDDLNSVIKILLTISDIPATLLNADNLEQSLQNIISVSEHAKTRNTYKNKILNDFNEDILSIDAKKLLSDWNFASTKWFLPKYFMKSKISKILKQFSINNKIDNSKIVNIFNTLINYHLEQHVIDSNEYLIAPLLGFKWQDGNGNWEEISLISKATINLNKNLLTFSGNSAFAKKIRIKLAENTQDGYKTFLSIHEETFRCFDSSLNIVYSIENKLKDLLEIDFSFLDNSSGDWIDNSLIYIEKWQNNLDSLKDWINWNRTKEKALKAGLLPLIEAYEKGHIQNKDIISSFKKDLFHSCADFIISQDEQLASFNGKMFEEKIRKYKELDKKFEILTKEELYAKLASKVPSFFKEAAQSSEIGILQRNIRNGGRGISIRKLFDTIPTLLTRIYPCMLMSPISVAQYIDAGNIKFDLIVFDEASQVPTCEAVGAIARGNNVIVVGDPKQLPPTSFFSINNFDEENYEKEDLESILDDCLALSMPSKHLLWHYRSKHESLIAFSNSQYYENKLLTFPSPDDITTKVALKEVKGFYDRGKTRQNKYEADAIIEEIVSRLSDSIQSKKSIGVVTFSIVQQILIEDMLNEIFKQQPNLEQIATESAEPIFIKNLENVQGDERDVILFSVCYGPDIEGKIYHNFGPLNRDGGWRRLNVAISRARYEMKVFSTLKAEQIDIRRTASEGVSGLKAFLEYAEKGKSSLSFKYGNSKANKSFLVELIAAKIKKHGFDVHTNIGCSGYKIDIGIINPEKPSEYILGILCDGYNYCTAITARDREIIQPNVLKLLGWNIHKIWSCDWWDNQEKVINEILEIINNLNRNRDCEIKLEKKIVIKEIDEVNNLLANKIEAFENNIIITDKNYCEEYKVSYPIIQINNPSTEEFLKIFHTTEICEQIKTVIDIEAPISQDLLCKRILSEWGISRIGSRIETHFTRLFSLLDLKYTIGIKRFFWRTDQNPNDYFFYRITKQEQPKRDALDIAPEEFSNAIREILEYQISMNREDLFKETANLFGIHRLGNNVETSIIHGIEKAIERKFIKFENERFHIAD